jgi:hypothetical protein
MREPAQWLHGKRGKIAEKKRKQRELLRSGRPHSQGRWPLEVEGDFKNVGWTSPHLLNQIRIVPRDPDLQVLTPWRTDSRAKMNYSFRDAAT